MKVTRDGGAIDVAWTFTEGRLLMRASLGSGTFVPHDDPLIEVGGGASRFAFSAALGNG